ncbi:hypothetical protein [Catelliglobosispora koreensis]|uniref:hypothetical protein n=1 Tax=Catelliglobosispora koreensis TaxID=129052 RepID=UPI00036EBF08|nr:hypothetical protein [Catelliglobosispora koreensis]
MLATPAEAKRRNAEELHPETPPPSANGNEGTKTGGQLTKVTVNLVPRAVAALDEVAAITHDTKTEAINRSLQLYAYLQKMIEEGYSVCLMDPEEKTVVQLQLF